MRTFLKDVAVFKATYDVCILNCWETVGDDDSGTASLDLGKIECVDAKIKSCRQLN